MATGGKGAELKAGLVVLAALVILLIGLFLVSGGLDLFRAKQLYTVLFSNAGGVKEGDAVNLAGRRVGEVFDVGTTVVERDGTARTWVAVTVELNKKEQISTDSRFLIAKTITGIVTLNIEYGDPNKPADSDTLLFGEKFATFEEVTNEASELIADARGTVQEIRAAAEKVNRKLDDLDVKSIDAQIDGILKKIDRAAAAAESDLGVILKEIREEAEDLDGMVKTLRNDWREMSDSAKRTLVKLEKGSEQFEGILTENREPIKELIQNVRDGSARVGPVMLKIERVLQNLDGTITEIRPKLKSSLSHAQAAMSNFSDATEDLKTAPWKLINKPSDTESKEVHLYNAARLYVDAAVRIQELVDDLDALRQTGALEDAEKEERIREVLDRLERSLRDFDENERALVDLVIEDAEPTKERSDR
ncbi:MAG: MlaD family protein [Planctomycetota bacterium]|jgi:ABC-type transporter Mla subunit MlaD